MAEWIGVDLDGTLARCDGQDVSGIGEPIPAMVDRVKEWLANGIEVRIVTARANARGWGTAGAVEQMRMVQDWCEKHGLTRLEVTCEKDFAMIELWDDRAIQVELNTGRRVVDAR